MQQVSFPYRSESHPPFLRVIRDCGAWKKYGLDVDVERFIRSDEAHEAVKKGTIDFVSGNHLSPYARRLHGDDWCFIGQSVNSWNTSMIVRKGSNLQAVKDLKGKIVAFKGGHPGLNTWLLLKRNGIDTDSGQATLIRPKSGKTTLDSVVDGDADAAFVASPYEVLAKRVGLEVLEAPKLPMIFFTTISTSFSYTQKNPETCLNLLRGISDGIRFILTHKNECIDILKKTSADVEVSDRETAESYYSWLSGCVAPKLYPTLDAIQAVHEIAVKEDPDAGKVNPMELWNIQFLRQLDDAGQLA
jgi:ABC-type nitrate/sulfonate/bicarbonate transport system substrate-binding protein